MQAHPEPARKPQSGNKRTSNHRNEPSYGLTPFPRANVTVNNSYANGAIQCAMCANVNAKNAM
jgi:hypothetical protein